MRRVTGLGGIFFKADNPDKLYEWYDKHLGVKRDEHAVSFQWRDAQNPKKTGMTIWALFPQDTKYFDPSRAGFMLNYRVENLNGLLDLLRKEGVPIDEKREDCDYGRFAWIMDPEGNRIELWEPPQKAAPGSRKAATSSKLRAARKSRQKKKSRKKS
jgi:catechol 2,3-dioxygenase-like lactoylglutathione lyase family enzyme